MVGFITMTWYSNNSFWNCRDSDMRWCDWPLLSEANWCSSNASWVCSGLGIITVFLLNNSFLMSCLCIVPTWCTRFYHVVLIWSADAFWPQSKTYIPRELHSPLCLGVSPNYLLPMEALPLPRPPQPPWNPRPW